MLRDARVADYSDAIAEAPGRAPGHELICFRTITAPEHLRRQFRLPVETLPSKRDLLSILLGLLAIGELRIRPTWGWD